MYYMNSPSASSSSACIGFSADHNQSCHGIALFGRAESRLSRDLGFSRAKSRHGLGLSSAESSSIRLFSRLPRKEGQYYTTNSPFTPVGGESTKPVLCRHTTSFSIGKPLVSMSDPFSSVWIFARTNSFSSTLSRNQWYLL